MELEEEARRRSCGWREMHEYGEGFGKEGKVAREGWGQ